MSSSSTMRIPENECSNYKTKDLKVICPLPNECAQRKRLKLAAVLYFAAGIDIVLYCVKMTM